MPVVPFKLEDADGTTFREITPDGYVEGTFMLLKDGRTYFLWSDGGETGPDYAVAYATADSPLGPFRRIGRNLEQGLIVPVRLTREGVARDPIAAPQGKTGEQISGPRGAAGGRSAIPAVASSLEKAGRLWLHSTALTHRGEPRD